MPHKFRCPVCTFAHPLPLLRALPKCGHTFCATCTPRLERCPLCRVGVGGEGVRVHIDVVEFGDDDEYDDDGEEGTKERIAKHARYVRKGLARMGADTPLGSVRKAQEELGKIADAEPVPLLLQALTDFKERIIPLFELADTLKRCKADLAACHSRISTLEADRSLETDRSRADELRREATELRREADELRREATELRREATELRQETAALRHEAESLRADVHRQTRLAESAVDTAARAGAEVVELRRANRSLLHERQALAAEVARAVKEREAAIAEGARDRAEVVRFQGIVQGHQMKAEAGKRKRKGLAEEVKRLERENKRLEEVLGQKELELGDSLRVISESQEQEFALPTSDFATSSPQSRPAPSSSSSYTRTTILRSSPPLSCNDPEPQWTPGATFGTDWNLPVNESKNKKRKVEVDTGPENNLYKARGFPIRLDARGRERGVVQLGGRRGLGRAR